MNPMRIFAVSVAMVGIGIGTLYKYQGKLLYQNSVRFPLARFHCMILHVCLPQELSVCPKNSPYRLARFYCMILLFADYENYDL